MSTTTAIIKQENPEKDITQFVPFGAADAIKLSAAIVQRYLCNPTKGGHICTERDAIKFVMLCKAQRLNPFAGDAFIIGYDGAGGPQFSLVTAHQAFLKRAESCPDFEGMESGIILIKDSETGELEERSGDFYLRDEEEKVVGGWAKVYRKGRKPTYRRIRMDRFYKDVAQWKVDAAGMIVKCFDPETEVLTTRGFEKFAIAEGDVLQVTPNGLEATNATPFCQNYIGPMVGMFSDDVNFCVTPNHDMATNLGKIEAGTMFEQARSRSNFSIARLLQSSAYGIVMEDNAIKLAAAYLADGSDKPDSSFWISVSRPHKISAIESMGLYHAEHGRNCAGDTATANSGRTVTTRKNKRVFGFKYTLIDGLVSRGKQPDMGAIIGMSKRQARLFVDTLIAFDGSQNNKTGVRRFGASNPQIMKAFELASVVAGYSVSPVTYRTSDGCTVPHGTVTISERDMIPICKWGNQNKPGLVQVMNNTGKVWCVTVPSGMIVVRRKGFSMLCHNCAEADALRSTFPSLLGGLYMDGEHSMVIDIGGDKSSVTSSRVVEIKALPDATPAQALPQVVESKPTTTDAQETTPQTELADFVIKSGFNFDQFKAWADGSGMVAGIASLGSFDEMKADDAKRCLRAKTGLLNNLKAGVK